jgi:hypothetical protein
MAEPEQDDLAKVQGFIKEQVETYFQEQVAKTPALRQVEQQHVVQQEDDGKRQLRELIDPFIKPDLDEARFAGADAQDYVKFYTNNPDAAEYQEKVEATFTALKKAGKPLGRADILDYLIGQEYRHDKDKFTEKLNVKRKEQLERAESASDFGAFSVTKAKNDKTFADFDKLPLEDMEKLLEGVTF